MIRVDHLLGVGAGWFVPLLPCDRIVVLAGGGSFLFILHDLVGECFSGLL